MYMYNIQRPVFNIHRLMGARILLELHNEKLLS